MKDPIIDEVRQSRLKIERDCLEKGVSYVDHILAIQDQLRKNAIEPDYSGEVTHTTDQPIIPDVYSVESRIALAKMVINLFQLWKLSAADQLALLGLSTKSRSSLSKLRAGKPLPELRDIIDRVGWLMSIHRSLGLLYPYNNEMKYSWVNRRNHRFGNSTPIEVMLEQGLIGIAKVARYLDYYRGL